MNYAHLTVPDESYAGPTLKIYDSIFSRKRNLDSRILADFLVRVLRAISEILRI